MPALDNAEYLFKALSPNDSVLSINEEVTLETGVQLETGSVLCFSDYNGHIGLIIPADADQFERFNEDRKSRAIQLTRRKSQARGEVTRYQARLILRDHNQRAVFYAFADKVLEFLDGNPAAKISDVAALLVRWRSFFSGSTGFTIDSSVELGLLCELEVLLQLHEDGVPQAVEAWYGPFGDRHDFVLPDVVLECKASESSERMQLTIHGAQQLEPVSGKPLRLVFRRYQRHPDGGLSIPSLVEELQTYPSFNVEAFLERLSKLGIDVFNPQHRDAFNHFFAVDVHEFDITDEFPKVVVENSDERIQNLQYNIDLAGPSSVPGYQEKPQYIR